MTWETFFSDQNLVKRCFDKVWAKRVAMATKMRRSDADSCNEDENFENLKRIIHMWKFLDFQFFWSFLSRYEKLSFTKIFSFDHFWQIYFCKKKIKDNYRKMKTLETVFSWKYTLHTCSRYMRMIIKSKVYCLGLSLFWLEKKIILIFPNKSS